MFKLFSMLHTRPVLYIKWRVGLLSVRGFFNRPSASLRRQDGSNFASQFKRLILPAANFLKMELY